jgi:transposase
MINFKQREKIIQLYNEGQSIYKISQELNIAYQTVKKIIDEYEKSKNSQNNQNTENTVANEKISDETREFLNENASEKSEWDRLMNIFAKIETDSILTTKEIYDLSNFLKKHFFNQDIVAQKIIQQNLEKASEKSISTKLNDIIDDMFSLAIEMHYLKKDYEIFCRKHSIDFITLVRNALKVYVEGVSNCEELHKNDELNEMKEILQYIVQLKDKQLINNILMAKIING